MRRVIARTASLALVTLLIGPIHKTEAQTVVPDDFRVHGHLDVIAAVNGTLATADSASPLSISQPLWTGGWVFECRSGLQPQTQRVGQFYVYYSRTKGRFGEAHPATVLATLTPDRPDVEQAYRAACPAVGKQVGFLVALTPPPDWGLWTLTLDVLTTDGAGHQAWMPTQRRDVFFWP